MDAAALAYLRIGVYRRQLYSTPTVADMNRHDLLADMLPGFASGVRCLARVRSLPSGRVPG